MAIRTKTLPRAAGRDDRAPLDVAHRRGIAEITNGFGEAASNCGRSLEPICPDRRRNRSL